MKELVVKAKRTLLKSEVMGIKETNFKPLTTLFSLKYVSNLVGGLEDKIKKEKKTQVRDKLNIVLLQNCKC